tara:strand:- start:159 stop:737 length:579 start_codon:yes stop_codon:yes gene_type:complete
MTTRIERMSQAYRDSKPSIDTGGIIRRVQLESALAEEEAGIAVGRFGQGMGLVQSLGAFTGQLSEQKRLAKRAGEDYGILDFLVGSEEAKAAADIGSALEKENKVMFEGRKVDAPSIYESEILDVNKSIQEFRSESEKATEAMLGRPMTKKEKAMGLTDEELGMQYTDEEVKGLGLQRKKTRFQNLLEMLRG